jgi:hypothetical protein
MTFHPGRAFHSGARPKPHGHRPAAPADQSSCSGPDADPACPRLHGQRLPWLAGRTASRGIGRAPPPSRSRFPARRPQPCVPRWPAARGSPRRRFRAQIIAVTGRNRAAGTRAGPRPCQRSWSRAGPTAGAGVPAPPIRSGWIPPTTAQGPSMPADKATSSGLKKMIRSAARSRSGRSPQCSPRAPSARQPGTPAGPALSPRPSPPGPDDRPPTQPPHRRWDHGKGVERRSPGPQRARCAARG